MSHLDGLRESRKAVIAVTLGWRLFRENEQHMTDKGTQGRVVGVEPLGVGPDGKLGFPDRSRVNGSSDKTCDNVRMQASFANSHQMFMDLIGQANRSSTSFYTVDAAGLRTEQRPHTATPLEAMVEARNRERVPYSTRLDSIRDPRRRRPTAWPSSTPTISAPACAAPPPTSTPTICSATRRPTASRTGGTARSRSR